MLCLRVGTDFYRTLYGSQIGVDRETDEYYVRPLDDPDNVNKRRAQVGLGPIEDYVSIGSGFI